MKKFFLFSLIVSSTLSSLCSCKDEINLPGYRASYLEQMLNIDYLSIGAQKSHRGSFQFSDTNGKVNKIVSKNDQGNISLTGGLRQVQMQLGTHFRPKNTLYAVLGSTLEYNGIERWKWIANGSIQPDVKKLDFLRTTRYIGSLHGRFAQTKNLGYHVGVYVETGMRATLVRPILGVDYTKGPWLYQALFPIKAGASYIGLPHHIFSFMIRSIYTATKVQKGLHQKTSVLEYKATGAELRWDLSPNPQWNFWISLGHTLTNSLLIGDKNFHHSKEVCMKQAPYAQIGINIAI